MRRLLAHPMRSLTGVAGVLLAVGLVVGVTSALAVDQHGIGFTKGCVSPAPIGSAYTSSYTITNTSATHSVADTVTITSIVDTVKAAGGNDVSGNVLDLTGLTLAFTGGASCDGTKCTLPFNSSITTGDLSHYTVTAADFTLPGHVLPDTAELTFRDSCNSVPSSSNCPANTTLTTGAGSQADVTQLTPTVATDIHAGAGAADTAGAAAITHAPIGSTVHDKASVSGSGPTPTGTVDFTVFDGIACGGAGTAAGSVALAAGVAHPSNDATVPVAGLSYRAHYGGDGTYTTGDGPCEPLTADKLTPTVATDIHAGAGAADTAGAAAITHAAIGSTVHDKASVSGSAGTPTGTVDFTVFAGTACGGAGTAAGSVALVAGVAHPSNDATVAAGGLSYRAHYGGDGTYDPANGPCEPLAALNANIQITPATATNPVGTNHTLTITVNAINGLIDAGPHTATATIIQAPGSFVGPNTCTYTVPAGGAATASCTVVITSAVAGTTIIQATSDIPVNGVTITRTTNTAANTAAGGSGNAQKIWESPGGLITDTTVSCNDVLSGNASNFVINQVNYPGTTTIGQGINPGKFFFWTKITVPAGVTSVTVSQSNSGTPTQAAPFLIHQDWQRLYSADCSKFTTGTQTAGGSGATFTVTPGTSYIIGIKYDPKSLVGKPVPVPATVTYTFTTSLGGTTGATVKLGPAH